MEAVNYNKYENFIRVGSTPQNLADFPTPSTLGYALHDLDKDAFTDLMGYTHRNRIRNDVYEIRLGYNVLSDEDEAYILNAIKYQWIYVEVKDKKTLQRTVKKMYASDKENDTLLVFKDDNNKWHAINQAFTVTFVEQ